MTKTLDQIALEVGTDKASSHHSYTSIYEKYFKPLRTHKLNILELGWGGHEDPDRGGESARLWREYFPNATIVVIDNEAKNLTEDHIGIEYRQLSQDDEDGLDLLSEQFGPWDIIIDDASHLSSLSIRSWEILYPHLKSGAYYAVEDTHSSYHAFHYGNKEAHPNPSRNPVGHLTMMNYLKRLADEVNFHGSGEWDLYPAGYHQGYFLESLTFFFNLAIITK